MWKEEMGKKGPGYFHAPLDDGAGKNYGMFSFTQKYDMKNVVAFMKANYPGLYSKLKMPICSTAFDKSWTKLGVTNRKKFKECQIDYALRKMWLNGVVANIKKHTGVNLNNGKFSEGVVSLSMEAYNWAPAIFTSSGGTWGIADILKKQYGNKFTSQQYLNALYLKLRQRAAANRNYSKALLSRWKRSYNSAIKLKTNFKYTKK
jgi:hypothetical protein